MGYNVLDLINKAINIAIKRKAIYENIGQEKGDRCSIKMISKVLVKGVDRSIEYYEILKIEIGDEELEEIDFEIYDKMSFLINDFHKRIYTEEINNVQDFFKFSIYLEKDIQSLLIDIQGRFVKNISDVDKKTYKILGDIIETKAKHIATLEKIIK